MEKNPIGRPTLYKPEYCEEVLGYMRGGASIKEIAYLLKVARSTIYEWIEHFPDFSDTIKRGVEFSEGWWMLAGKDNIYNKDFNSTLWYMNMKNRFGWSDKTESTHNVTVKQEDAIKELG